MVGVQKKGWVWESADVLRCRWVGAGKELKYRENGSLSSCLSSLRSSLKQLLKQLLKY